MVLFLYLLYEHLPPEMYNRYLINNICYQSSCGRNKICNLLYKFRHRVNECCIFLIQRYFLLLPLRKPLLLFVKWFSFFFVQCTFSPYVRMSFSDIPTESDLKGALKMHTSQPLLCNSPHCRCVFIPRLKTQKNIQISKTMRLL